MGLQYSYLSLIEQNTFLTRSVKTWKVGKAILSQVFKY